MVLVSVWFIFIFHIRLNFVSCCFSGRVNLVGSPVDFWLRLRPMRVHDEIREVFDCRCCFSLILLLPQCEMTSVCAVLSSWDEFYFSWFTANLEHNKMKLCAHFSSTPFGFAVDMFCGHFGRMSAFNLVKRDNDNHFKNVFQVLLQPAM